jgi:hypothetical protein
VGVSPTRQPLQPEATGAVMEVTKWLKPSVSRYSEGVGARRTKRDRVPIWPFEVFSLGQLRMRADTLMA